MTMGRILRVSLIWLGSLLPAAEQGGIVCE